MILDQGHTEQIDILMGGKEYSAHGVQRETEFPEAKAPLILHKGIRIKLLTTSIRIEDHFMLFSSNLGHNGATKQLEKTLYLNKIVYT